MKKIYLLLLVVPIFFISCEKEEVTPEALPTQESLKTVHLEDGLNLLYQSTTKTKGKQSQNSHVVPNIEESHYLDIKNSKAKMLVIPATNMNPAINSRIFILEINGSIEPVIFNLYPDEETGNDSFSGRIGIFDKNEEFVVGYKIEAGTFVSKYVLQKNKNELKMSSPGGVNVTDPVWDDGELNEVFVDADRPSDGPILIVDIYPNRGGNGTKEETSIDYLPREGGSTTTPTEEEEKIDNNLTDPCARTLFKQLLSGIFADDPLKPEINLLNETLNFNEAILALFSESTKFHYTIENGDLANPKASAHTIGSTITLNNLYLSNATELSIARTIIHETLHTYLNFKYQNSLDLNNMSFRQKMDLFASEYGFNPNGDERDKNRFQHEFMGQYVDAMAYSLYEWDKSYGTGGNLGWDYYYKMAAAGLSYEDSDGNGQFTDSFYALFTENEDIQEVIDITNNEKEGNDKAKGTKC